jgi:hypothetical protein
MSTAPFGALIDADAFHRSKVIAPFDEPPSFAPTGYGVPVAAMYVVLPSVRSLIATTSCPL